MCCYSRKKLAELHDNPGMLLKELGQPEYTVIVDGKIGVPPVFAEMVIVV